MLGEERETRAEGDEDYHDGREAFGGGGRVGGAGGRVGDDELEVDRAEGLFEVVEAGADDILEDGGEGAES